MKIAQGCWLSKDNKSNDTEIQNIIDASKAGNVDIAVVGNEVLYRKDMTEKQLLEYIKKVREAVPEKVTVATTDTYDELLKHPNIINAVDLVIVNIYPYWEGIGIEKNMSRLQETYKNLKAIAGGKEVWIGETGFPSAGDKIKDAVPSVANAAKYFSEFTSWADKNKVKYFYFEAFDEKWKELYEGKAGSHWGVFTSEGKLKPGMEAGFKAGWNNPDTDIIKVSSEQKGNPPEDKASSQDANVNSSADTSVDKNSSEKNAPEIKLTYIPKLGSRDFLEGTIKNIRNPEDYYIVLYIKVGNSYWVKPYKDSAKTLFDNSGDFSIAYATGGTDENASQFQLYLMPKTYEPPLITGDSALPVELDKNAAAKVVVNR
jgi:hypothetical protein